MKSNLISGCRFSALHTDDPKKPWDGSFEHNGKRCQSDVYIYKILVSDESTKQHELLGHVTLVN